jgi:UDP-N-acetylglucosamine 2-epimerase (non-hydrolysing)
MTKILICIGTSGELIKIAPVMRELQKRKIQYFFLNTGQHNLTNMIKELEVKLPNKEFRLINKKEKRGRFETVPEALRWGFIGLFLKLRKIIKENNPKFVIVHGDTMTTALTSIVSKTIPKIKLAHVEGGIRSHSVREPFPEELMRKVTDTFADILFAPTDYSTKNVKHKKEVIVTGNTNIDSLLFALNKIKNIPKSEERYLIAKTHRQENIKSNKRITNFIEIITKTKHKVYFILTPNTKRILEKLNLMKKLQKKNITIVTELPYLEFIKLYRDCTTILTDGGGETEEATYLKKPCIVYRYKTERQEAEHIGVAIRVSSDVNKALNLIDSAFNKNSDWNKITKNSKCPYGDGKASKRIVDYLIH